QLGVARSTVYKWLARHREEGEAGLVDRSSRPHRSPTRLPVETEAAILALRQQCHRGAVFLAGQLGLVASTVGRVLRRRDVPPLSAAFGHPLRTPRPGRATAHRRQETRASA